MKKYIFNALEMFFTLIPFSLMFIMGTIILLIGIFGVNGQITYRPEIIPAIENDSREVYIQKLIDLKYELENIDMPYELEKMKVADDGVKYCREYLLQHPDTGWNNTGVRMLNSANDKYDSCRSQIQYYKNKINQINRKLKTYESI